MTHPVVTPSHKQLPKKPVKWWGSAIIYLTDGQTVQSDWHSRREITVDQAREAMQVVIRDMLDDITGEPAVDSGFVMQCR